MRGRVAQRANPGFRLWITGISGISTKGEVVAVPISMPGRSDKAFVDGSRRLSAFADGHAQLCTPIDAKSGLHRTDQHGPSAELEKRFLIIQIVMLLCRVHATARKMDAFS